jgi:molecular chaperone HscB
MDAASALARSHFEWFGLPERFALDSQALDAAFRNVQSAVHPDRFAQSLDAERRIAMQLATRANEAYRVLRDPARRAAYLCERHGIDLQVETRTAMPKAFLLQQLDWRERLADARTAGDGGAIESIRSEMLALRGQLLDALVDSLDTRHDYDEASARARELMFLDRFASDLEAAEDDLLHR